MAREKRQSSLDVQPRFNHDVGIKSSLLIAGLALGSILLLANITFDMRCLSTASLAGILGAGSVFGQNCQLNSVRSSPPTDGSEVALQSYSYCGGELNVTVFVDNTAYNKVVTLYYTNRQDKSTPLSVVALDYKSAVSGSNWEYWTAGTPIYIDGISRFLNVTYEDVDNGQTYDEVLNLPVKASGAPEPSLPSPPKPYATPSGFGDDITQYLDVTSGSEAEIAHTRMFINVNPPVSGATNGTVVAARSGPTFPQKLPDYEYNWVRDASLTMDVVQKLYAAATDKAAKAAYETILFEYAAARATEQHDPNLQTGLGEPKFYLNNTIFSGPWGRPQNDGPATSAITLMGFANDYLTSGGSIQTVNAKIYGSSSFGSPAPVLKDLLFVASNWSYPSFDLWEEVESDQFYTRMVQRRALVTGASFATKMGDSKTSATLTAAANSLSATMSQFWDPNRQILLYEYGPVLNNKSSFLDTAVILGVQHGYAADGFYSYTNDRVLSTALRISTSFINVYPIANKTRADSAGNALSPPVGRYPEDVFNGTGTQTNGGNPWYLCTASFAQFMYSASAEYTTSKSISVTTVSKPFFDYYAPEAQVQAGKKYTSGSKQFKQVVSTLNGWGDAFMRTVKYYTPSNGHLHEEINRDTGVPQGAADLTWSYASVISAALVRSNVIGAKNYARDLANLGVAKNA